MNLESINQEIKEEIAKTESGLFDTIHTLFSKLSTYIPNMGMTWENSGERGTPPVCSECQMPVQPENARTDEDGEVIHAECFVLRLRLRRDYPQPE
jgi:hypothetical protein